MARHRHQRLNPDESVPLHPLAGLPTLVSPAEQPLSWQLLCPQARDQLHLLAALLPPPPQCGLGSRPRVPPVTPLPAGSCSAAWQLLTGRAAPVHWHLPAQRYSAWRRQHQMAGRTPALGRCSKGLRRWSPQCNDNAQGTGAAGQPWPATNLRKWNHAAPTPKGLAYTVNQGKVYRLQQPHRCTHAGLPSAPHPWNAKLNSLMRMLSCRGRQGDEMDEAGRQGGGLSAGVASQPLLSGAPPRPSAQPHLSPAISKTCLIRHLCPDILAQDLCHAELHGTVHCGRSQRVCAFRQCKAVGCSHARLPAPEGRHACCCHTALAAAIEARVPRHNGQVLLCLLVLDASEHNGVDALHAACQHRALLNAAVNVALARKERLVLQWKGMAGQVTQTRLSTQWV